MVTHGKYEAGRMMRSVSARVIRTFGLRHHHHHWVNYCKANRSHICVRHLVASWQVQQLQISLPKHRSGFNAHWSRTSSSYTHPVTRAHPETDLRPVRTQTLTSFVMILLLLRAHCRSCCSVVMLHLSTRIKTTPNTKEREREGGEGTRGNTHSSVSPGILNLSRWAFMAVLDSTDLLCTYFFSPHVKRGRKKKRKERIKKNTNTPALFEFFPSRPFILLHLAVRWDRRSPVEN